MQAQEKTKIIVSSVEPEKEKPRAKKNLKEEITKDRHTMTVGERLQPRPILKKPLFPAREMLQQLEPALPTLQFREIEPASSQNDRALRRTKGIKTKPYTCLLYTSPSPRDGLLSRMPSSA